jgi:hypothetical protein
MRILREFDRHGMKITILSWNGKISIKCEKDLMEQTFKFRDGSGIEQLQDAETFLDEVFLENVNSIFHDMSEARYRRWEKMESKEEDSFRPETII